MARAGSAVAGRLTRALSPRGGRSDPSAIVAAVRKWTWLALAIVVTFVGVTFLDDCALEIGASCPPACHFACLDGCAVAPIEAAVLAPAPSDDCREVRGELTANLLDLDSPPELIPPRA